jgi:hypothetical protein
MSRQRRHFTQTGAGQELVEKVTPLVERLPEAFLGGEFLPIQHLVLPSLMRTFRHGLIGRLMRSTQGQGNPQRHKPQMQASGIRRFAGVVVKDALPIDRQAIRQSPLEKGQAQDQLLILRGAMAPGPIRSQPTGVAHHFDPAEEVIDIDQGDDPHRRDLFMIAGVHFPFFVTGLRWRKGDLCLIQRVMVDLLGSRFP